MSWPPAAQALLARACEAYGGEARWRELRLRLVPRAFGGALPNVKGLGRTFSLPSAFVIDPAAEQVIFEDFPTAGAQGRYRAGVVSLHGPGGETAAQDLDRRATFRGRHRLARWQPLDALYFFGYALAHYHALPFCLGEARCLAQGRHGDLETLTVEFPVTRHTHSRRQRFYFDESGLIVRHDYVADIVGPWARGAHFWREQRRVDGFPVAFARHVVLQLGGHALPTLVALHAELSEARVVDR